MRNHLFIDSLDALASQLETALLHLLARPQPPSQKAEALAMHLTAFKGELYRSLAALLPTLAPSSPSSPLETALNNLRT